MQDEDSRPATAVPITNRRGDVVAHALVDRTDADAVGSLTWRLWKAPSGLRYAAASMGHRRRQIGMHRYLLGLTWGDGLEVDHVNGNGLDNRRANLRLVTHAQNLQNKRGNANGSSRYRGVHFDSQRGLWRAQVRVSGRQVRFGRFASEDEAGAAAAAGRAELMTHNVEARSVKAQK